MLLVSARMPHVEDQRMLRIMTKRVGAGFAGADETPDGGLCRGAWVISFGRLAGVLQLAAWRLKC